MVKNDNQKIMDYTLSGTPDFMPPEEAQSACKSSVILYVAIPMQLWPQPTDHVIMNKHGGLKYLMNSSHWLATILGTSLKQP